MLRGRVERTRGGGINTTTSRGTRDSRSGGKSDRKCHAPPSWDLAATALVLAAEAAAVLIAADNANGGNSGITIVSSASLAAGGGVIHICC